ncbi:IS4 family transposase, partial [Cupriavidus sp. amp6]|uniref:IS4 family transposase n=1 Tax=Cupriavidus sp. amp6 TaxID=388051 RepID=UPI0026F3A063
PKGTPVTLNQIIRLAASLGGFLGRKSDGEPGAKTIWIGMQRNMDVALTIQALREEP